MAALFVRSALCAQRQQAHLPVVARLLTSTTAARRATKTPKGSSAAPLAASATTNTARMHLPSFSNEELAEMVENRKVSVHKLETLLEDTQRAVDVRRMVTQRALAKDGNIKNADTAMDDLPHGEFDYRGFYDSIHGTNCEAVIGYMPVPVGVVGPLVVNGQTFRVPMATTEGALLASTNRGCRAITMSDGATSVILKNGMTRAPLVRVPSVAYAAEMKAWIESPENKQALTNAFNSTTRFGRLQDIDVRIAGRNVYVRFACHCGDAMGMNMVTKGTVEALALLNEHFPEAQMIALSGNVCSDKKAAAINWVEGRGRSVVCETILKKNVVENLLHTTVDDMIFVNQNKNLIGSAVAGSLGGFNAHAANIVAALFIATGNDPAQVIESSQCITVLEKEGEDLHMSVSMPSIEIGTVGGGTSLPAQAAALKMLGCQGANREATGANADTLAHVVASSVLAGEISLIAALATNDLLKAHIDLNRKTSSPAEQAQEAVASNTSSAAATGHPSATTTRGMHTSSVVGHAITFGHPSTGGPLNARAASSSAEQAIYYAPGTRLSTFAASGPALPHSVSSSAASADEYGSDGPMLPVP
ncbi:3-hydroxy-3-methylglutaryl coenzyme A reductase [Salpingoeca rosetta]|uniref:3-hydroxy-3-methylglutaryl coenzyme A reductase n=1 Tax=Salpingoeca rosetta (strain ATCC 50818 / BSB-021) TaxID=946362 RepID=F2UJ23_SALR5|nr:3-hydroxy-3-methylglutaryl coenzyme A reductase [Salpingoeca rosetta]EGD76971.1 3-hydroxy-3-methylglutaryl coenzyme A reductase [Salpingoeca rosetta]|eukprot:XP_004990811.1 3-hydroxy-3-methylglutaryl coenzyme A reductase [Salpingoeca rosetta]